MHYIIGFICVTGLALKWYVISLKKKDIRKKGDFIANYNFSDSLKEKVGQKHPQLTEGAIDSVFLALKDFFFFCVEERSLTMPSKVVDDAWHEFILFTKEYQDFCIGAYGKARRHFLHHTPAESYKKELILNRGKLDMRRVWRAACENEGIDRKNPEKLPRLFAIDKLLEIEGGHFYSHMKHPLDGEVSAHNIKCASQADTWACGSCGGD